MPRAPPRFPGKKKITEPAGSANRPAQADDGTSKSDLPESPQASLEAQVAELAASMPEGVSVEEEPNAAGKSELARHRAGRDEINQLVNRLPDRVREQMDQLFHARYTRIQKLDLDSVEPDTQGNH